MVIDIDEGNREIPQSSDSVLPEAASILVELSKFWDEVANRTGQDEGKFLEKVFHGMWEDNDTGDDQESILVRWAEDQPHEMQSLALIQASFTSCAHAVDAMKVQRDLKFLQAWRSISKANYWLGIVIGTWSLRKNQPESIKDFAKRGAEARHSENRAMKKEVFTWLDGHMVEYKSMDSAAEAISGNRVPVTFRTARDWVGEWKKLRPTGTP